MAKKFYWLKLNEDFFRQPRIKKLRRIAGGDTYTIIYLKMQLLSLENERTLICSGTMDDLANEIAIEIDENPEDIKTTLTFLLRYGMIKKVEGLGYAMTEIES